MTDDEKQNRATDWRRRWILFYVGIMVIGAIAGVNAYWMLINNTLYPENSAWNVSVPVLHNCSTVGTISDGTFYCSNITGGSVNVTNTTNNITVYYNYSANYTDLMNISMQQNCSTGYVYYRTAPNGTLLCVKDDNGISSSQVENTVWGILNTANNITNYYTKSEINTNNNTLISNFDTKLGSYWNDSRANTNNNTLKIWEQATFVNDSEMATNNDTLKTYLGTVYETIANVLSKLGSYVNQTMLKTNNDTLIASFDTKLGNYWNITNASAMGNCSGTDKVSGFNPVSRTLVCSTDQTSAGGGDGTGGWSQGSGTIYNNTAALKLGIGTANPASELHVNTSGAVRLTLQSSGGNDAYLKFVRGTDGSDAFMDYIFNSSGGNFQLAQYYTGVYATRFWVNDSDGFIGINTKTPNQQLTVNGNINASDMYIGSSGVCTSTNGRCPSGSLGTIYNLTIPATSSEPVSPSSGVTMFTEDRLNDSILAVMGLNNYDIYMTENYPYDDVITLQPAHGASGTTAPVCNGCSFTAAVGTVGNPPLNTRTYKGTMSWTNFTPTAGYTGVGALGLHWQRGLGNIAMNNSGFKSVFIYTMDQADTNTIFCVGMMGSVTAYTNVSNCGMGALSVNSIWVGFMPGSQNLTYYSANATQGANRLYDCGSNFPIGYGRTNDVVYETTILSPPSSNVGNSTITFYTKRLDNTSIAPCTYTVAGNDLRLPLGGAQMGWKAWAGRYNTAPNTTGITFSLNRIWVAKDK